jgi:thioredoxin-like negative regulator of GroEL
MRASAPTHAIRTRRTPGYARPVSTYASASSYTRKALRTSSGVHWPCRQMAPGFLAAAAKVEPQLRLGKLDTEAEPALAARFRIQSIPSLVLVRKGEEIARTMGAMPENAILQWIESAMAAHRSRFPARAVRAAP